MNAVYLTAGISKQGHWQAIEREREIETKQQSYHGFIAEVRAIHPGMGLRAMYQQYQPEGIGRDNFIALGRALGLMVEPKRNQVRTTFSVKNRRYRNLLEGRTFDNINQVWVSDITYFHVLGRFYYLTFLMDVYSRRIVGFNVADSLRAEHALAALQMALTLRGQSGYHETLIHHSDRGSQYIANDYTDTLENYGIQCSMCDDVLENAHSERAHGTIKNQYLVHWQHEIRSQAQLLQATTRAVETYNTQRHHSSLGMTPIAYEAHLAALPDSQRPQFHIYTVPANQAQPDRQFALEWHR
jgi:putative transposase